METQFLNETNLIKIGIFIVPIIFFIFTAPGSDVFGKFSYSYYEFDIEDGPI